MSPPELTILLAACNASSVVLGTVTIVLSPPGRYPRLNATRLEIHGQDHSYLNCRFQDTVLLNHRTEIPMK
jgi:hypothetical protein